MSATGRSEEQLSEIEIKILTLLYKSGGQYIQRNLWKAIGVDGKSGLPHLLRLEKRGYVTRERIGESKRAQYIVKLTPEGKKAIEAYLQKIGAVPKPEVTTPDYTLKETELSPVEKLIATLPCFTCPYLSLCSRVKHLDPARCEFLSRWIIVNARSAQI